VSYCRWSSDRFQCDVYVYESDSGFVTHIATRRSEKSPVIPWKTIKWPVIGRFRWWLYNRRYRHWSDNRTMVDIGLECDGESYNHDTAGECATHLEHLKSLGYMVPQYAIDALWEEDEDEG